MELDLQMEFVPDVEDYNNNFHVGLDVQLMLDMELDNAHPDFGLDVDQNME